jgi:hypothetical protein
MQGLKPTNFQAVTARLKRLLKNAGNEGHGFTRATKDRKESGLSRWGTVFLA